MPEKLAVKPAPKPWWRHRWVLVVVILLVLLTLVRSLFLETFTVPSHSMEPGLQVGDRIVVEKWRSPHRGDVIVFDGTQVLAGGDPPTGLEGALRSFGQAVGIRPGEDDYVKRVIGVGGDRVAVGADGKLRVNGSVVREPYLPAGMTASGQPFSITVPAGTLFVMGDNRTDSDDSRNHLGDPGGGMVPVGDVIGVVVWRYWPPGRAGTVH